MVERERSYLDRLKETYPKKFATEKYTFSHIRAGDRIFIGTGCGEPQYLVKALINYVEANPKAFFDAEILHVWTLGVAPYTDERFKYNFRHNSFFVGNSTREVVNRGMADYTPIFLSQVPSLFRSGAIPIDVALVQTSLPDNYGYLSLGISVDIVKAAMETASLVIIQVNSNMPRVHGDSFIHIEDVDFIIPYDEPLLEYEDVAPGEIAHHIGQYVAQIVEDGDTIQVGYGSLPNAILTSLSQKKKLGVHTELLGDGLVQLMKKGVVDNSLKPFDRGKTVAAFCMGGKDTYDFVRDNPAIEFRGIDYTNNPLIISRLKNIAAINSVLEIDLTGQATAESIGKTLYSGIGGQADFIRGASLATGGKTIIALQSTTDGEEVSRIVPFLKEGAGVTLTRGDISYVVTEYGRAFLHGKNMRERAMALISIAHPKFRAWLIEEAKKMSLIYADQAFYPGAKGEWPQGLETYRTTKKGLRILLRPVKISDEPLLKDFFYSLSEKSRYRRFVSARKDMPHEVLQRDFVAIDYTEGMEILAVLETRGKEEIIGIGQYGILPGTLHAEIALVIKDEYQKVGVGAEVLSYIIFLGRKQGLHMLQAEVLRDNLPVLHLLESCGFKSEQSYDTGICLMKLSLREKQPVYVE
jgi:acyl-CoA hydrolase/ribosomal protein S18 acetylase RimI-like enzyme